MVGKRVSALLFLLLIVAVPCAMAYNGFHLSLPGWSELWYTPSGYADSIEKQLQEQFPMGETIRSWIMQLQRAGGQERFTVEDGEENRAVYLAEDSLILDMPEASVEDLAPGLKYVESFMDSAGLPGAFVAIPTAAAIEQQKISNNAPLFNQKKYIEEIYHLLEGSLTLVDSYSGLFANREQYLYYRTQPSMTMLGGWYVYDALGEKLSFKVRPLEEFNVQYLTTGYYGSLYRLLPISGVEGDTVALYQYVGHDRQYVVTHFTQEEIWSYDRLYLPVEELPGDDVTDAVLGEASPVTLVETDLSSETRLLLIGDSSVKSYLPFLTNHYSSICLLDLSLAEEADIQQIVLQEYDQILFSYQADKLAEGVPFEKLEWLRKSNPSQ